MRTAGAAVAGTTHCTAYHFVNDADGLAHGRRLEAHVLHALVEVVDGDGAALELVEVELLDLLRALGISTDLTSTASVAALGGRPASIVCSFA